MPRFVQFRLIDAFAETPYTGNPAGVVLNADELDDTQMQLVAREINASETAFVIGGNDLHRPPRLRWFAPIAEVQFCGHATLATAHALTELAPPDEIQARADAGMRFTTAAGELAIRGEPLGDGLNWWLEMPSAGLQPERSKLNELYALLGVRAEEVDEGVPAMRTRDQDVILFLHECQRLLNLKPNQGELGEWSRQRGIRGICVSTLNTLSPSVNVHSRFFAPAVGIAEDPVTGSVHGALAVLLVANQLVPHVGGRSAMNCMQGVPGGRTGMLRALVETTPNGHHTLVGGRCHTTLRGEMLVPAS
ncbi:MAG: PhzF family phenazine biosynthesis protein [Phycisphaerae bacterium]|jgi:PhzF family phenazine biosynthesis protein